MPNVIIADADRWSAELLAQLVRSQHPNARLELLSDAPSVRSRCSHALPDLLIADLSLPGGGGLELLREMRRQRRQPPLPFFLIAAGIDARSVREVMPLAPTAFLSKPFDVEDLLRRLRQALPQGQEYGSNQAPIQETLAEYLTKHREDATGAPLLRNVQEALRRCMEPDGHDLGELEQLFRQDPQLTAQLIAAANSAAQHCGSSCQTLAQALPRLGLKQSLNLALGLALQRSISLEQEQLQEPGQRIWRQSQRVAKLAHWLALLLGADGERCYTAGLLHLLGDLAVLRSIQDWCDQGGSDLTTEQVEAGLRQHAAPFGSALRTRWRLPLELRQLIAACFQLGSGVYSREALILHLARLASELPEGSDPRSLADSRAAKMLALNPSLLGSLPELELS
ncbi:HDOD domain-containing protein [Aquipseudomonas alcaligenes]|uniref:HDOD domain-containing protein n=1 Tax=Aquipseudomonas alcaligenes TaxID=43263 RepID=UPI0037497EA8